MSKPLFNFYIALCDHLCEDKRVLKLHPASLFDLQGFYYLYFPFYFIKSSKSFFLYNRSITHVEFYVSCIWRDSVLTKYRDPFKHCFHWDLSFDLSFCPLSFSLTWKGSQVLYSRASEMFQLAILVLSLL